MKFRNQNGFTMAFGVILVFIVISIVGFAGWQIWSSTKQKDSTGPSTTMGTPNKDDEPPKLKSIGFNLDYYNPSTSRAGDFHFTPKLAKVLSGDPIYQKLIWSDYGIQDIRSPNDPTKRNVQPTFHLPLGTKVLAPIDGEVTRVETLYSNDYTIWFAKNKESTWSYEMEHVINPIVKVGDKVIAGQVVAEVSPWGSEHNPGFGIMEIGLFHSLNNEPAHWCPFVHFDDSIKEEMNKKILALYTAWEAYMGDDSIYNNANYPVSGCATLEPTIENTTKPTPSPAQSILPPKPSISPTAQDTGRYAFEIKGYVHDVTDAPAMTSGIPVAGIVIRTSGPKIVITQTLTDGSYTLSFTNAPLGTYDMCVTIPAGYRMNPPSGCETVLVRLSEKYDKTLELINNGNTALHWTAINFNILRQ